MGIEVTLVCGEEISAFQHLDVRSAAAHSKLKTKCWWWSCVVVNVGKTNTSSNAK